MWNKQFVELTGLSRYGDVSTIEKGRQVPTFESVKDHLKLETRQFL